MQKAYGREKTPVEFHVDPDPDGEKKITLGEVMKKRRFAKRARCEKELTPEEREHLLAKSKEARTKAPEGAEKKGAEADGGEDENKVPENDESAPSEILSDEEKARTDTMKHMRIDEARREASRNGALLFYQPRTMDQVGYKMDPYSKKEDDDPNSMADAYQESEDNLGETQSAQAQEAEAKARDRQVHALWQTLKDTVEIETLIKKINGDFDEGYLQRFPKAKELIDKIRPKVLEALSAEKKSRSDEAPEGDNIDLEPFKLMVVNAMMKDVPEEADRKRNSVVVKAWAEKAWKNCVDKEVSEEKNKTFLRTDELLTEKAKGRAEQKRSEDLRIKQEQREELATAAAAEEVSDPIFVKQFPKEGLDSML